MLLANVLLWLGESELALEVFGLSIPAAESRAIPSTLFGDSRSIPTACQAGVVVCVIPTGMTSSRAAVERVRNIGSPRAGLGALDVLHISITTAVSRNPPVTLPKKRWLSLTGTEFTFQSTVECSMAGLRAEGWAPAGNRRHGE